jgi:cullin-associated NEDD8-dissociated protein 1
MQLELVDISTEFFIRMGAQAVESGSHQKLLQSAKSCFVTLLHQGRTTLRKRVALLLGTLSSRFSSSEMQELVNEIIQRIQTESDSDRVRSYIIFLSAVCRGMGAQMTPLGLAILKITSQLMQTKLEDDDLRESCLQTLEVLVGQCPDSIQDHLDGLLNSSLRLLRYDPNYLTSDESHDEAMQECESGESDADSEIEYSDDEDTSWKVRRSAARFLATMVCTNLNILESAIQRAIPLILICFKEREESVRNEILRTFSVLLHRVTVVSDIAVASKLAKSIQSYHTNIVTSLNRMLNRVRMDSSRQIAFGVMREAAPLLDPKQLLEDMPMLLASIRLAISSSSTSTLGTSTGGIALKSESILLLSTCIQCISVRTLDVPPAISSEIISILELASQDRYHKLVADALQIANNMIPQFHCGANRLRGLYDICSTHLATGNTSTDEEVKDRALSLLGTLLIADATLASDRAWEALVQRRLGNEISRLGATRVVTLLAQSPGIEIRASVDAFLAEIIPNLRKNVRNLRERSLQCINAIIKRCVFLSQVTQRICAFDLPLT